MEKIESKEQKQQNALKEAYQDCTSKMQSILDNAGDSLSEEKQKEFDVEKTKAEAIKAQLGESGRQVRPDSALLDNPARGPMDIVNPLAVDAQRQRNRGRVFADDKTAFRFGHFIGAIVGNPRCMGFCQENRIQLYNTAMSEGNNTTGGYLVPIEFSNTLINLRNEYGVFRRFAFVDTMISDTKNTPRLTGHAQHYYVGEGGSITPSYITLDQIKLIAKKPAILIIFSRELADDSMIALGNLLADELAWTMSYAEDLAGFNGDGTSTYGGIVGVINQLTTINGVDDGGGIALAATSHNLYSELTLDDFTNTIARCPAYAKRNARWYCSSYFYSAVMLRLLANVSGNTIQSIEMGASAGPIYLGYPVIFSEVLSTVQANSQICCLFGDLAKAATLGDRQGITIEYSNAATIGSVNLFETDQTAIRGLERYDINVHDVGTATVAGPVVGLMTAAS